MESIKFDCNGCGKCCTGSISLTYKESIKHNHNFVFAISYTFKKIKNEHISLLKNKYEIIKINNLNLIIIPEIISTTSHQPCINITKNNMCSIYETRPKVCRLYPIRIDTNLKKIKETLLKEKEMAEQESQYVKCEGWENTEKIIFIDNSLTNNNDLLILKNRKKEEQETFDLCIQYFKKIAKEKRIIDKLNNQEKGIIISDYFDFIKFLEKNKKINKKQLKLIKRGQISANNRLLDIFKNKPNLSIEDEGVIEFSNANLLNLKNK